MHKKVSCQRLLDLVENVGGKNMESVPHIEIKIDGVNTKMLIDGKELKGVRSYCLSHDSETKVPVLKINLLATDLSLDANMIPTLPEAYQEHYIAVAELIDKKLITKEQLEKL